MLFYHSSTFFYCSLYLPPVAHLPSAIYCLCLHAPCLILAAFLFSSFCLAYYLAFDGNLPTPAGPPTPATALPFHRFLDHFDVCGGGAGRPSNFPYGSNMWFASITTNACCRTYAIPQQTPVSRACHHHPSRASNSSSRGRPIWRCFAADCVAVAARRRQRRGDAFSAYRILNLYAPT